MIRTTAAVLVLAAPVLANGGGLAPLHDSFDTGLNQGGWIYNGADVIETEGGNPGGWLHNSSADTFYPIWTAPAAFAGDWAAAGVTKLEFDARTLDMDFGDGTGFEMSILVRDTKGTPTVTDDDTAWLVGPNVPLVGAGWKHFEFDVPATAFTLLPAGWAGSFSGDGNWVTLMQSVDQVEIVWSDPSLFAIFQMWDIGLDNVSFRAAATSVVRNGSGTNPVGFAETDACEIGTTWTTTVDLVTPGAVLSLVTLGFGGPTSGGFFPPSGEALVLPPYRFFVRTGTTSLSVPNDLTLLGACLFAQGSAVLSDGTLLFNNALDVVIGG